jgi:phosphotransferase system  glucose/maltose/N-acetylglucosamine-specific IIC component
LPFTFVLFVFLYFAFYLCFVGNKTKVKGKVQKDKQNKGEVQKDKQNKGERQSTKGQTKQR